MPKQDRKGICFVISSRGNGTSDAQRRTDQLVKHVIQPAAEECGYEITRADQLSQAGLITSQVIDHLIDDPLVIADVGYEDPKVFYELAVRHAANKPVIQITLPGRKTPFEITGNKTIPVDHKDLDSAAKGRDELAAEIRTLDGNPDPTNPLAASIDLETLSRSTDLQDRTNVQIITRLEDIKAELREVHRALLLTPPRADYTQTPSKSLGPRNFESEPTQNTHPQYGSDLSSTSRPKRTSEGGIEFDPKESRKPRRAKGPKKGGESKSDDFDLPVETPEEEKPAAPVTTPEKDVGKRGFRSASKTTDALSGQPHTISGSSTTKKQNRNDSKEQAPDKPLKPGKRGRPERRFAHVGTPRTSR